MLKFRLQSRTALLAMSLFLPAVLSAQAPTSARQAGTVTSVDGNAVTIKTTAGAAVIVTVNADAKVMQVPPGAKDLSAATPATVTDVLVGDKVLANGVSLDASTFTASRLIVMKSTDINAMHAAEQQEWVRGLGGLVKTVDGSTIAVTSGVKTITINTSSDTVFKRYADDSIDFSNAKPGTLAMIHSGDQLRARGTLATDRLSIMAKEVVTGSFENLSGVLSTVNSTNGTLTLKDLTTKKMVTVAVTAKSDLRRISAEAAARFAARGEAGAGAAPSGAPPAATRPVTSTGTSPETTSSGSPVGRRAGADLSQMLSRLPTESLADLKPGQAVMIVASEDGSANPTAITLLSGVEPILSATPAGKQPITLSPWNLGGAEPGGDAAGGPR